MPSPKSYLSLIIMEPRIPNDILIYALKKEFSTKSNQWKEFCEFLEDNGLAFPF